MSSSETNTSEVYDPCDYILCGSNLRGSGSTTEELTLKKCGGCSLARYCSRECQKSDWQTHKVWCHTHKATKPEDGDNWRRLHRRLYAWRRTQFNAIKDAFLACMELTRNRNVHRTAALSLVVSYKPRSTTPTCMRVQQIEVLDYMNAATRPYAPVRLEYERQLTTQRHSRTFYGAGMVIVRIQHVADVEGETAYAIPIPITAADASMIFKFADWGETLLALRLLKGTYLEPESDVKAHDMVVWMLRRNLSRNLEAPQKWAWTREDEGGDIVSYANRTSSPQMSLPNRLHEAEPYFRKLLALPDAAQKLERSSWLLFVFGDCLASIPGKEEEALEVFRRAQQHPTKNDFDELKSQGYISRMLRRMNRVTEAVELENTAAYVFSPGSRHTRFKLPRPKSMSYYATLTILMRRIIF
ncbi:hypothetical protein EIP86_007927 [Pleurotus ostreatoroseus]|nr:hypothetical protein EIP86_007927 [Pleurotus ostreatoroseus]